MTQDELDILTHFRAHPKAWLSIPELAKQLGGKHRFAQDPDWPRPFVKKFTNKNLLEMDASGAYRVKPKKPPENRGPRIFLTPEIKEALRRSGKKWQFDMDDEVPADEYEMYLRTGKLQMGMKSSA